MAEVIFEIAPINQPFSIADLPKTAFFVVMVLSSILYACFALSEIPLSVSQTIREKSLVVVSISPIIFSLPIGSVPFIATDIGLSIVKTLGSCSVLQRVFELSFVSTAIFHDKDTKSFNFILFPLADIAFAFGAFPHATASLASPFPLSVIELAVAPFEDTSTMPDPLPELSFVARSIWEVFVT